MKVCGARRTCVWCSRQHQSTFVWCAQDLSNGYFDAGDYIKYGQPAAYAISVLAWSILEFKDEMRQAGALEEIIGAVRWGTDYILNAGARLDEDCTYAAQVGRGSSEGCTLNDCVRRQPCAHIALRGPCCPIAVMSFLSIPIVACITAK